MKITTDLIHRCSSKNLHPGSGDEHFERITHLFLQDQNIRKIENLECCKNLTALYLYDNKIEQIENLDPLAQLKILYLHCNFIPRIENLEMLSQLTVLNLAHNCISKVEGLQALNELRELYLEYQTLPEGQVLEFDPETIHWLSDSLKMLNVSGNKLERFAALQPLKYLEVFIAEENEVSNLEQLTEVVGNWKFLVNLKLSGNPVCTRRKYIDDLIVTCIELEELDGKVIQTTHRNFLLNRRQCLALESLKKESYKVLRPFLETQIVTEWGNLLVPKTTAKYFKEWIPHRFLPFWHTIKHKYQHAIGSLTSFMQDLPKLLEGKKPSVIQCQGCNTRFHFEHPDPEIGGLWPSGYCMYIECSEDVMSSLRMITNESEEPSLTAEEALRLGGLLEDEVKIKEEKRGGEDQMQKKDEDVKRQSEKRGRRSAERFSPYDLRNRNN